MEYKGYGRMPEMTGLINDKVGRGLKLDGMISPRLGSLDDNTGIERINQSIKCILSTRIGERFFLPDFGSKLHLLLFERNNYILQDLADLYVREALKLWEPRITVVNVTIPPSSEDNIMPISITYTLTNTNKLVNYVYPFIRSPRPLGGDSIEY